MNYWVKIKKMADNNGISINKKNKQDLIHELLSKN